MNRRATRGAYEWAVETVNCLRGCSNRCRYCYALLLTPSRTYETWGDVTVRGDIVRKKWNKVDGVIMFPSMHGIPSDPELLEPCMIVLGKLLRAGNRVIVVTKQGPQVIQHIMKRFARYKDQLEFRFTITTLDPETQELWEPGAPSIADRLTALRLASAAGWKTSVAMEPYLDPSPKHVIKAVERYVTGDIWIGPMNHTEKMQFTEDEQHLAVEANRLSNLRHVEELYLEWKDYPKVRFKDEDKILKRLEKRRRSEGP